MSAHTQHSDADLPLIVSRFPTATQSYGPAYGLMDHTTWTDFTAQIQYRRQGQKDGPNFVPCTFRVEPNGKVRRQAENVVARTAIALDVEPHKITGEVPPTVAATVAKIRTLGWTAVLYSSHSHTAALPRYRIVIPLDSEIGKHLPAVEVVASALGLEGVLDTSKVEPASVFYLPSCEPGTLTGHETAVVEGEPISAAWMTEQAGAVLAAREAEQARLNMEALEAAAKRREERIARGFDPNSSLIELIRGHLDMRGELESHGYKVSGKGRYLYPGSETGVAGVYLMNGRDGVERVYSHHSGDPLAAGNLPSWCFVKAIDVVDVVIILDHAGDQKRGLAALATRFGIEIRPPRPEPEPPNGPDDPGYYASQNEAATSRPNDPGKQADPNPEAAEAPELTPADLPTAYFIDAKGIWFQPQSSRDSDTQPDPVFIAAPFEVIAETKDETGGSWGLLLRWTDRDQQQHQWAMPRKLLHADGNAIASELEDAGLSVATGKRHHDLLKSLLSQIKTPNRMRCVNRSGWHQTECGMVYVLPSGGAFGPGASGVILQSEKASPGGGQASQTRGTLKEWQDNIGALAVGNDRMTLFISSAFASSMLYIGTEPSGGIHLYGKSQDGKTTTLAVASSVWGRGDSSGQIRTWRATANGFEGVVSETCDALLALDEIGQADAREVGEVIYMLANEAGKARANRDGSARARRTWRTLFLSTGEVPLATKMQERGNRAMAGQDVRLLSLPANAGGQYGVFQNLHNHKSAAAFATHLREASRTYYGTPARAFLDRLTKAWATDSKGLMDFLTKHRNEFEKWDLLKAADGQVLSIARRFALIAAAGELGVEYGVLPWPKGEATKAAKASFRSWLTARGGTGAGEDVAALSMVRKFIELHDESRFTTIENAEPIEPVESGDKGQKARKNTDGKDGVSKRATIRAIRYKIYAVETG